MTINNNNNNSNNSDSSQIDNIPLEQLLENTQNESNVAEILQSDVIINTSQSSIEFTRTNVIPNQLPFISHVLDQNNIIRRQHARRSQLYHPSRQHHRQQEYTRRNNKRRSQFCSERYPPNDYSKDMSINDEWEQEQINELETFAALEQLLLIQDEIEQQENIDIVEKIHEQEQHERKNEELRQLEQWEREVEKQYQERLQKMTFEQRFDLVFEEKLRDYQSFNQYHESMEFIEQKQVQDFEEEEEQFEPDEFYHNVQEPTQDFEHLEDEHTFILARTSKEKKTCVATRQSKLNASKIIERTIKHTNVLYICSEEQWQQKVNNYMEQTGHFLFIGDITSETSANDIKRILMNMSNLVVKTLHVLLYRRAITNEQYSDMMFYNQSIKFDVNKLDFIPKIRHVKPMKGILHLVNNLLQPLIQYIFYAKRFPTANEAIEELIKYEVEGNLQSKTFFVTIQIHDLRTTLSHDLMIEALQHFFQHYARSILTSGIPTITVIQLIRLILENQFCMYENKLYRQTVGSSIDSPLITALIDIYLFYWQYDLIRRLNSLGMRCFGRCFNQIFFTWNKSKEELLTFLYEKNRTHSRDTQIQKTISIDYKINYLDAEISHHRGILHTKVYHNSKFEPYALPYLSKTRRDQSFNNDVVILLRAALYRAILYCSNVYEFDNERLYIEISFLLNDISLYRIQQIIEIFFIEFHMDNNDMPMNEYAYQIFRIHVRLHYQQHSKYYLEGRRW
ncbi:unnamed protein product [Adineta steineri]|uniref:Uncharacterized protein n=1 Tax=Adineta steineri TaxID=433720 RepID=A0A815GYB8_9BILA|nr:unnamed protein product [Adineta steineri]CAF1594514.1 unnamed protein product [Adineta steineri]